MTKQPSEPFLALAAEIVRIERRYISPMTAD
jgi:hypothetical protein